MGTDFKFAGPLAHGVLDHKVSFLLFNQSPLPPQQGNWPPKLITQSVAEVLLMLFLPSLFQVTFLIDFWFRNGSQKGTQMTPQGARKSIKKSHQTEKCEKLKLASPPMVFNDF